MRRHYRHVHPLFVLLQQHFRHFLRLTVPKLPLPPALSVPYRWRFLPVRPAPSLSVQTLPHCPHPLHRPERPAWSVGHYHQQSGQTHQQHLQSVLPASVTLLQPLQRELPNPYFVPLTVQPVRRVPDPSLLHRSNPLHGLPFPQSVSSPPGADLHPLVRRETHSGYPAHRSGPHKCRQPQRAETLPASVTHCNNPVQPQCCSGRSRL